MKKSYNNDTGTYSKEYSAMHEKLVPHQGEADTLHGEALRAVGNIYADIMCNGGGNLVEDDGDCGELVIRGCYESEVSLVESKTSIDVKQIIFSSVKATRLTWYEGEDAKKLETIVDDVMEYVIKKDKEVVAGCLTSK